MHTNQDFRNLSKNFWANVRTISEAGGYSEAGQIKVYSIAQMRDALSKVGLGSDHIESNGQITELGETLLAYFEYRAHILNTYVEPRLMDVDEAKEAFYQLKDSLNPTCPLPMNKQKGEKRAYAYLTGMVNMLIEAQSKGLPCDYDPRNLTSITRGGQLLRTLARRVDGCFTSYINPVAIWEIKEYYYTTTFGSRIADGIYETLLDGLELEELREHEGIKVLHYLMVDSHYTWWVSGRSYLCRIIDMLQMGYVDEVLFGREVIERLPELVAEWVLIAKQ
jgi:hypothetical protein